MRPKSYSKIVLRQISIGHLGDSLCLTPMPRLLTQAYKNEVFVASEPILKTVFENNPYVYGYSPKVMSDYDFESTSYGHIIHRIQNNVGVLREGPPRPEIYLNPEEIAWAQNERESWATDKPICLLSVRVVTDRRYFKKFDWQGIFELLNECCQVVQPVLTEREVYQKNIDRKYVREWTDEQINHKAILYENLPIRKYFALFAVSDLFCGTISGGSHVAAAFAVPSIIMIWRSLLNRLKFPQRAAGMCPETFLYPQHDFLAVEDMATEEGLPQFEELLKDKLSQTNDSCNITGMKKPFVEGFKRIRNFHKRNRLDKRKREKL